MTFSESSDDFFLDSFSHPDILITSFATWREDQTSNASDDLLELMLHDDEEEEGLPENMALLRQVPVEFEIAPMQVLAAIAQAEPDWVICLGMAENIDHLQLERFGKCGDHCLETPVDLVALGQHLPCTISEDAGDFVCNHLYYELLKALEGTDCRCLFVHVPVLTEENQADIVTEFWCLLCSLPD